MSNSLIQSLFSQISRLQSQNSQLKSQLNSLQAQTSLVCKYTQIATWPQFIQWVTVQYETASERTNKTYEQEEEGTEGSSAMPTEGRVQKVQWFGKDGKTEKQLTAESMKTSEILQEGTIDKRNSVGKFKTVNLSFQKTRQRTNSQPDLNEFQQVIIENTRLRKYSQQLERQLSGYLQNIKNLVNLVGSEDSHLTSK